MKLRKIILATALVVVGLGMYAGYSWFGGKPMSIWWVGAATEGIDVTREMWTFLCEHRLGGRPIAGR